MRILFMGTPDFACPSLEGLYGAGHHICGVFTQPDKPKHRGMQLLPPPVKELAAGWGIPVYQPKSLKDGTAAGMIQSLRPELIVVVAYGKILPQEILDMASHGCINVHASLLPQYRGAAPIQWAILQGEEVTGVTIMQMDAGLDTGDIITAVETEISPRETAGDLFNRLKILGADTLVETVSAIEGGRVEKTPQNHEEASYAPPLTRDMSPVDWTRPAKEIVNQIRGLNPWPVATATIGGRELKLYEAHVGTGCGRAGDILSAGNDGLEVAAGSGSLVITQLQAPGKRRMSALDYMRGKPF